jgi:hypothetical protein
MTTPPVDSVEAVPPPKPAPRWEDFIDIFHSPSTVYERRQNQSPWPTIWIITVLFTLVTALTFNGLEPLVEAEMRAEVAKQMAKNPQMTQDMADMGMKWQLGARRWGGVFFPIGVLITAIFVWLLAKIVGAKETYKGAMIVVTYASILSILQALLVGAQALVLDVSSLTTPDQLSFSAARFVDKASTSPVLYALLKALDVFGIWLLLVMAIGVEITGKVTRSKALTWAAIWFVLSVLIMAAFGARAAAG